jgi:hypothetical protein
MNHMRRAERFPSRQLNIASGGGIEQHDVLGVVHGDDRVHRRIEDAPHMPRCAPTMPRL